MTQTFERNNFLGRTYTGTGGGVFPTPVLLQYEQFAVDRSRLGLNGAIQFEIAPEFTITADALYSKLKTGRRQDFFAFRLPTGNNPVTNRVVDDGMVVAGNANGTVTTAGQIRNEPTESFLYGLNGKYEGDNGLTIEADGYYSKGTIDQAIQIITLQGTALVPGAFDFRDTTIPSLTLTGPFNPANYASYNPATNGVRSNRLIGLLDKYTGKLDVSYETGGVTIAAGVRYTDLHARSNALRSQVTPTRAEIEPPFGPGDVRREPAARFQLCRLWVWAGADPCRCWNDRRRDHAWCNPRRWPRRYESGAARTHRGECGKRQGHAALPQGAHADHRGAADHAQRHHTRRRGQRPRRQRAVVPAPAEAHRPEPGL